VKAVKAVKAVRVVVDAIARIGVSAAIVVSATPQALKRSASKNSPQPTWRPCRPLRVKPAHHVPMAKAAVNEASVPAGSAAKEVARPQAAQALSPPQ
jgi:hypothetical protein